MSASFAQFVFTLLQKTLHKTELKTQKWTKAVFLQLCRMLSYTMSVKNHNKNQTRYAHIHNLVFFLVFYVSCVCSHTSFYAFLVFFPLHSLLFYYFLCFLQNSR